MLKSRRWTRFEFDRFQPTKIYDLHYKLLFHEILLIVHFEYRTS